MPQATRINSEKKLYPTKPGSLKYRALAPGLVEWGQLEFSLDYPFTFVFGYTNVFVSNIYFYYLTNKKKLKKKEVGQMCLSSSHVHMHGLQLAILI